jgi:two-component system sensor histidine kinase/response regulator
VEEVCRHTGWHIGHVLKREAGDMVSAGIWYPDDADRFLALRRVSEQMRFPPEIGLPGRVLATGKPLWISDVTQDENFPRAKQVRDLGVHAGVGFPVLVSDGVACVLEFFSEHIAEPDEPLLEVMATIGLQLGRVIERQRSEEALRRSEERFRSVAQTATDAIISADVDGVIVSWNRGAEAMFGHTEDEVAGTSLTRIIPERHRQAHEQAIARLRDGAASRLMGRTVELEGLRRDGSEFPLELSLATWTSGNASYYTGILRDITERRIAELKLREAATNLERSERAAVDANRAKSVFLAHMSHELRTPLNAILGFSELLQRDRGLSDEQRESLSIIVRSGHHLLGLINDVLSLSKIEAGESTLYPVDFEPRALLESLRDMFRLRAEARGLVLVVEGTDELPAWVRGDQQKLRQVLINLLGNALKFTEAGGVTLRVRWETKRATFEVEDTGSGISPAELDRLFEPFAQAEAGLRAAEGTGLGLAICRDVVRLLGGNLYVRSEPGRGSCFTFTVELPEVLGSPRLEEGRRVLGIAPSHGECRMLVVDDDPDGRLLLTRLLEAVGFVVRQAADGQDAIAVWSEWQPALVWMDMRMPVLDGYQATSVIRRLERGSETRTPIIALTASAFEHDRPAILECGCDDIVAKPFNQATIFEVIVRYLPIELLYEDAQEDTHVPVVSVEQLRSLPQSVIAELRRALAAGDDRAAERALSAIEDGSAVIAELRRLIKTFQFNELLGILERLP